MADSHDSSRGPPRLEGFLPDSVARDGSPVASEASGIPSAPRKLSELKNQLRDAAQYHRTLFEAGIDAVFVIDCQGTIVDVNTASLRLFEYAKDDIVGRNVSCLMPEPWSSHHDEYLQRYLQGGPPKIIGAGRSVLARKSTGECFPVELSVCEASHRGARLFVGTIRDVSARLAVEAEKEMLLYEVQVQEQRLRAALDAARLGVWELDVTNEQVAGDPRAQEIWGEDTGAAEVPFHVWFERVHPDDRSRLEQCLRRTMSHGAELHEPVRLVLRSGELRHVILRSAGVKDAAGETVRLTGVVLDVTEQVRAEERLRKALFDAQAANRVKTEFLATMSHEIRTPMNGVLGMANLLIDTRLEPFQREYVETIRASGENLLSLINDVLDFSKIDAGNIHLQSDVFSIRRMLSEVANLFRPLAEQKGLKLELDLPPEGAVELVSGDATRVRQVVINLMSNAVKFTEHGQVTLRYTDAQGVKSADFCVSVEDTGIGMSEDFLKKAGQAFTQEDASPTRRFGGTGLGLAICKNLVHLMNGRLEITSRPGQGSSVKLFLPIGEGQPSDASAARRAGKVPPKMSRALVVEDNVVNQRVMVQMLKAFAQNVDVANDGQEGVDRFQETQYDCILMDGLMPNVDGLEATRRIRQLEEINGRRRTPIIAVTAHALAGDRELFLASGTDEYLTKPVRKAELVDALNYVHEHVHPWGRSKLA